MKCNHCGHELPTGSRFCNHCGAKAAPIIPEGFMLDAQSGWYFKSIVVANAKGQLEQLVTYYDADTDEYTEVVYPMEQEAEQPKAPSIPQTSASETPVTHKAPAVPEGFMLDAQSGWYFKSAVVTNEKGHREQLVAYYDADTDEYTEVTYPMEQEAEQPEPKEAAREAEQAWPQASEAPAREAQRPAPVIKAPEAVEIPSATDTPPAPFTPPMPPPAPEAPTPAVPEGFILDERSGLYYTSVVATNAKGQHEQLVTFFNVKTGEYTQASYPVGPPAPPPPPKAEAEKAEFHVPPSPPPAYEIAAREASAPSAKKPRFKAGKAALVLLSVALLIGVGFTGYKLGWFSKPKAISVNAQTPSPQGSELPVGIESTPDITASPSAIRLDLSGDWGEGHAHSSYLYSNAKEDETHIYFLPDAGYTSDASRLYRMEKDGSALEEILSLPGGEGITNFALLGDMLYYSVKLENEVFGYFAVAKEGGNASFLFFNEDSNIVAYNGKLYFMFFEQDALGVFDPAISRHTVNTYPLYTPGGQAYLLKGYSVYENALYYGIVYDDGYTEYYRYDLRIYMSTKILAAVQTGAPGTRNPFFLEGGDVSFISAEYETGMAYWKMYRAGTKTVETLSQAAYEPKSGSLLTAVRLGDHVLYQSERELRLAQIDDPASYTLVYEGDRPFAVCDNWVFTASEAISLDGTRRISYDRAARNHIMYGESAYKEAYSAVWAFIEKGAYEDAIQEERDAAAANPENTAKQGAPVFSGTLSGNESYHTHSFTLDKEASVGFFMFCTSNDTPESIEWYIRVSSAGGGGFELHNDALGKPEYHQGEASWTKKAVRLPAGKYTVEVSAPEYLFADIIDDEFVETGIEIKYSLEFSIG